MSIRLATAFLAMFLSAALPQQPVNGPSMGYLFDPRAGGLRPVLGIPGSSVLGEPVSIGVSFSRATVSPHHDFALVTAWGSGDVLLVRLDQVPAATLPLGTPPAPRQIVLSPNGSSAALYYRAFGRIQVLTGLPESPVLAGELDASLAGTPRKIAISDDGQYLLAVAQDGTLALLSLGAYARVLPGFSSVNDVRFADGSHDAYLSDGARGTVAAIRDLAGDAHYDILATSDNGIAGPVAIALPSDNSSLYIANQDGRNVATIPLSATDPAAAIMFTPCDCRPDRLEPLAGTALFRLTGGSDGPLLMFDAVRSRVTLIPADLGARRRGRAE